MTRFAPGETVVYNDDETDRSQRVELEKQTTEPAWANEPVWLFTVLEDGPMFKEGEQSYARDDDLDKE